MPKPMEHTMTLAPERVPAISVLMPVYNGEKYLREAIDSILGQTFTDFEFIIVDDGSTDATPRILEEYAQKDSRVRVLTNEVNSKIAASLNRGLAAARAPLIARMDADDISLPQRLEKQYQFMQENKHIAVCGTAFSVLGKAQTVQKPFSNFAIKAELLFTCCIAHPTVIYRKESIPGYCAKSPPAEDYDLWLSLVAKNEVVFANLPDNLLLYRRESTEAKHKYDAVQDALVFKIRKGHYKQLGLILSSTEEAHYDTFFSKRYISAGEYNASLPWLDSFKTRLDSIFPAGCEELVGAIEHHKFLVKNKIRSSIGLFWQKIKKQLKNILQL